MAVATMHRRLVYLEEMMGLHAFRDLQAAVADDAAIESVNRSPGCKTLIVKLTDRADQAANPMASVIYFLNERGIPFSVGLGNTLQAA